MRVYLFELEKWEREYLAEKLGEHNALTFYDHPIKNYPLEELKDAEGLVVFIYSQVDKSVLDALPNLKFISTMSTGFDHIDIEECKRRGIVVSNVSGYGEITVAEHTFALILALTRKLVESVNRVRSGEFSPEGLTGTDLRDKKIGVIGVGSIGKNVCRIAKGFGMNVIGYKRSPDVEMEQELGIIVATDLDYVYRECDIISLHVPYSTHTHHMLNNDTFQKMKDGVLIINTARGGLIDTGALLEALNSGKVGGAGLDVLEEEPLLQEEKALLSKEFNTDQLKSILQDHMLINHSKVVITPHNAFNSIEALHVIINTTKDNIEAFINGSPQNVVNAQ